MKKSITRRIIKGIIVTIIAPIYVPIKLAGRTESVTNQKFNKVLPKKNYNTQGYMDTYQNDNIGSDYYDRYESRIKRGFAQMSNMESLSSNNKLLSDLFATSKRNIARANKRSHQMNKKPAMTWQDFLSEFGLNEQDINKMYRINARSTYIFLVCTMLVSTLVMGMFANNLVLLGLCSLPLVYVSFVGFLQKSFACWCLDNECLDYLSNFKKYLKDIDYFPNPLR